MGEVEADTNRTIIMGSFDLDFVTNLGGFGTLKLIPPCHPYGVDAKILKFQVKINQLIFTSQP